MITLFYQDRTLDNLIWVHFVLIDFDFLFLFKEIFNLSSIHIDYLARNSNLTNISTNEISKARNQVLLRNSDCRRMSQRELETWRYRIFIWVAFGTLSWLRRFGQNNLEREGYSCEDKLTYTKCRTCHLGGWWCCWGWNMDFWMVSFQLFGENEAWCVASGLDKASKVQNRLILTYAITNLNQYKYSQVWYRCKHNQPGAIFVLFQSITCQFDTLFIA